MTSAVACTPYMYSHVFSFLGFFFNKVNCFEEKKVSFPNLLSSRLCASQDFKQACIRAEVFHSITGNPQQRDSIYARHLTSTEQGPFCLDLRSRETSSVVTNWL